MHIYQHHNPQNKGNKKEKSSYPKELEQLVSLVPASKLTNPAYAGYTELLLMGSWDRFWCVVHTGSLYVYQSQEALATTQTFVLKGIYMGLYTFVLYILLLLCEYVSQCKYRHKWEAILTLVQSTCMKNITSIIRCHVRTLDTFCTNIMRITSMK